VNELRVPASDDESLTRRGVRAGMSAGG